MSDGAASGLGAAYDVLSAISKALVAAYTRAGPLSDYYTPMTRALYAARVASALRGYTKALASCKCKCGLRYDLG